MDSRLLGYGTGVTDDEGCVGEGIKLPFGLFLFWNKYA